jgi:hypothetical protein
MRKQRLQWRTPEVLQNVVESSTSGAAVAKLPFMFLIICAFSKNSLQNVILFSKTEEEGREN